MDEQAEFQAKLQTLRVWLAEQGLDGIILNSQTNFAWITGGGHNHVSLGESPGVASLLVTSGRQCLLTNNIEVGRILEEEVKGLPVEPITWTWHEADQGKDQVARLCDLSRTVSDVGAYGLPEPPSSFAELRYTMLPVEQERYRLLGRDAAEAVENTCRSVQAGDSELDVAARLGYESQKLGILPLVNLVAGDERIAQFRHPLPTEKRFSKTLMVVLTGRRQGLHISLTRMVSFGQPDSDLERRHLAVGAVDARFNLESRAGVSLAEVFQKGTDQYTSEGFPQEWDLHHQGGLTGYAGREIFGTASSQYRLKNGQVVTWNPSITGTKSEDTVLLTEAGPEVLTRTGAWPEFEVELPVGHWLRPAILVRD